MLAELTFGVPARSCAERAAAFPYKNKGWLRDMREDTAATLTALAHQFGDTHRQAEVVA